MRYWMEHGPWTHVNERLAFPQRGLELWVKYWFWCLLVGATRTQSHKKVVVTVLGQKRKIKQIIIWFLLLNIFTYRKKVEISNQVKFMTSSLIIKYIYVPTLWLSGKQVKICSGGYRFKPGHHPSAPWHVICLPRVGCGISRWGSLVVTYTIIKYIQPKRVTENVTG